MPNVQTIEIVARVQNNHDAEVEITPAQEDAASEYFDNTLSKRSLFLISAYK